MAVWNRASYIDVWARSFSYPVESGYERIRPLYLAHAQSAEDLRLAALRELPGRIVEPMDIREYALGMLRAMMGPKGDSYNGGVKLVFPKKTLELARKELNL
ncbi:hypothetical protein GP486_008902 [Trichoglossum hirsutum]|uniref:Uncharacterized protein n=1 Tax=Trichoglossum hirsutum TaxID=265104 RepID=A0A9P8I4C5_9PEZI|nr:hypothetical protein GP486_008902 [Trichoglossum hirsutum]